MPDLPLPPVELADRVGDDAAGRALHDELERLGPGEPRELAALRHNVRQLQRESALLRHEVAGYATSRSWRLTAPLRRLAGRGPRRA